jgi:hypothetical protein
MLAVLTLTEAMRSRTSFRPAVTCKQRTIAVSDQAVPLLQGTRSTDAAPKSLDVLCDNHFNWL